ncbi:MAG: hypothetical protein IKF82_01450 [Bacilli bacterium]|nr:hypothetical protein [Bacilli bacterium]
MKKVYEYIGYKMYQVNDRGTYMVLNNLDYPVVILQYNPESKFVFSFETLTDYNYENQTCVDKLISLLKKGK